jgi:hypothetical protein
MTDEDTHRDFLLAALRAASVRARLMEADLNTIGVALKGDLISNETAVRWIMEAGLLGMVGAIPEEVGRCAGSIAEQTNGSAMKDGNGQRRPVGDCDAIDGGANA